MNKKLKYIAVSVKRMCLQQMPKMHISVRQMQRGWQHVPYLREISLFLLLHSAVKRDIIIIIIIIIINKVLIKVTLNRVIAGVLYSQWLKRCESTGLTVNGRMMIG